MGKVRKHTDKPDDIWSHGIAGETVGGRQPDDLPAVADHHGGFERQPPLDLVPKRRARDRLPHDQRAGGADVDDVEMVELVREQRRPETAVAADVHASQEYHQRHGSPIRYHLDVSTLARSEQPEESLESLRSRLADLEGELDRRDAEITRTKTDLGAFRITYRREVGQLHEELEALQDAIAEAELGEFAKRLVDEGAADTASRAAPHADSPPRFSSDAVRKLFRDVAKTIHPDLARDEEARDRRHRLMVEANRAYALGDEERLRSILQAWENSPEAVQGSGSGAIRERLLRRIAQIEDQLIVCARELDELTASPLWELKVMVDEAASRGKDVIAEQVRRLKRDIMIARNRLDAIRWNP